MKPRLLLSLLCLLPISFFAQEPFSFHRGSPAEVSGLLVGYDPESDMTLELKFHTVVPTPGRQQSRTIYPNDEGGFSFRPDHSLRNQQIWFSIGDLYFGQLLLDKGLHVVADLRALREQSEAYLAESVVFSGPDGEMTHYVNTYTEYWQQQREPGQPANIQALMDRSLSPAEKTGRLREFYEKEAVMIREFIEENPSPHAWILQNERLSQLYGEICVAHWNKRMPDELLSEIGAHQPRLASNSGMGDYYSYLSQLLFIPTPSERIELFRDYVRPEIELPAEQQRLGAYLAQFESKIGGEPYDETTFKDEDKYFNQQYERALHAGQIQEFARKLERFATEKADLLKLVGGGKDIWQRELYVSTLLPTVRTPWIADIMEKEWAVTKKQLLAARDKLSAIQVDRASSSPMGESVGQLPNGAELLRAEQEHLDTLLAAIRSNFAGKALILDVWATWCGPCIYDMQNSAENRQRLRDMGVEVVYLCVATGSSEEKWKQKVAELDVEGTHLFLSPDLSKAIMDYFELPGYPSHVFLDKEGKYHPNLLHSIRDVNLEAVRERL